MSKINFLEVNLKDDGPFFAFRRVMGFEPKRRERQTLYLEKEFIEMFPPGALSDIANQALNVYAIQMGYVECADDDDQEPGE